MKFWYNVRIFRFPILAKNYEDGADLGLLERDGWGLRTMEDEIEKKDWLEL